MKWKIFSNWWLKLLSVLLAFIIWMAVVSAVDPVDKRVFSNIKVTLLNTELITDKDMLYEILDNSDIVSRVEVKAKKTILAELNSADIVATADFAQLSTADTIEIKFSLLRNDADVEVTNNKDVLKLRIEQSDSKVVKLIVITTGDVAEGYELGKSSSNPNMVNISGLESKVAKVSYAAVTVNVNQAYEDISIQDSIRLYDEDDNVILEDIKKNSSVATVNVTILTKKTVPVEFTAMGIPAEGYQVTGVIQSTPDRVTLTGTKQALSNVYKIIIPEEELNITGQSEDVVKSVDIKEYLPDGVSLAKGDFNGIVTVIAYIEPIMTREFNISSNRVQITNVPDTMTAELGNVESGYRLVVKGLEEQVGGLVGNQIRGTVDIAAWMEEMNMAELTAGTYSIPIDFGLDEAITISESPNAVIVISDIE